MDAIKSYVIPVKKKGKEGQKDASGKPRDQIQMVNTPPTASSLRPFAPLRPFVPNSHITRPSSFHQQSISRPPSSHRPSKSRPTSAYPPRVSLQPLPPSAHGSRPTSSYQQGGSRPTSSYPQGDFRNSAYEDILDIKSDVMVNYLYQQQLERMWTIGNPTEGVVLKKSRANYTCSPEILHREVGGFFDVVAAMNVRVSTLATFRFEHN